MTGGETWLCFHSGGAAFLSLPRPQRAVDDPPRKAALIGPFYSVKQTGWSNDGMAKPGMDVRARRPWRTTLVQSN